jgi:RND family efflux transporter MFP subunit
MLRKYLLPALALVGALVALLVVFWSQRAQPVPPIPSPAPQSPYENAIYGAGLIEASTENISIGTPFLELIMKIYVVEGDFVKAGDPLLLLDTRLLEAQRTTAVSQLNAAIINYENLKTQYSFYERLKDKSAVSEQALSQAYYAMLEAGEQVMVADGQLNQIETDIDRSTVRAPVDGEILQVNARVGEIYIQDGYHVTQSYVNLETALILMGTVSPMQMRIDIDEEDSWRFRKGAKATAFVRGNAAISFPMEFTRVEPYILPKTSYTGDVVERIDTRVLQVLYRFNKGDLPVYAGQLLDVYFEAPPLPKEIHPYPQGVKP